MAGLDWSEGMSYEAKTHVLDYLQIGCSQVLGAAAMQRMKVDVLPNVIGDNLLFQLTTYLQADHLCDETKDFHFSWPRGKWQAFKLRHPGRFVRRFPVKYFRAKATVEVKSWATFPESKIVVPDLGRPLYIQEMNLIRSQDD